MRPQLEKGPKGRDSRARISPGADNVSKSHDALEADASSLRAQERAAPLVYKKADLAVGDVFARPPLIGCLPAENFGHLS